MSIKQSPLDSAAPRATSQPTPVCWHRDRNRNCLRIEADSKNTFLFPYSQLVGAHHSSSEASETLRITFSTHEVILSGRELGEIVAALQDLSVDWAKPLPTRYQTLSEPERAFISQIEVKQIE